MEGGIRGTRWWGRQETKLPEASWRWTEEAVMETTFSGELEEKTCNLVLSHEDHIM